MIANLMMYERPELQGAHARFWDLVRSALADNGIAAPETLSQDADANSVWTDPEMVLSQTCGMPYRLWLHGKVQLIGTPNYALQGCPAGYYRSAFVVHADDPRTDLKAYKDAVFAYNQAHSQSGYAAAFWHVKPLGFWFEQTFYSRGHVASAKAVAEGQADIAAIDAQTWRNFERYEAVAARLRVLEWTTPTPGLPLITALAQDKDAIFDVVAHAIVALNDADRALLDFKGIERIPADAYLSIRNPDKQTP